MSRERPSATALATVTLDPADAAEDANWLYILAWQGGPGTQRIVDRLEQLGDGVYRSTEPIPLYGTWKSGLRLQSGRERGAVPIRLPADDALEGAGLTAAGVLRPLEQAEVLRASAGAELPAPASFERPFLDDGTDHPARGQGRRPRLALDRGDRTDLRRSTPSSSPACRWASRASGGAAAPI